MKKDPFQPLDDDARALTRSLIQSARFGALGVLSPETGAPLVTRVAVGTDVDGTPVTLISDLSAHTAALKSDPRCSVLLGEPSAKGDPLTHPRITLQCDAEFVARDAPEREELRAKYLKDHPKAKLYADFADFHFVRFKLRGGLLNGGFGRAYRLTNADFEGILAG